MGAMGIVILFMFLLVGVAVIALWVGCYAGHSFLTVLEQTAAGSDDVRWPDQPFVDWLGPGAYFWALAGFWASVTWLAVRTLSGQLAPLAQVGLCAGLAAFFFPLSLLSSVSATSRWVLLRGAVLRRLRQRWDASAAFFAVSAVLLGGLALANYSLFSGQAAALLSPIGAFASVVLFLIYARLIGKLWCLANARAISRGAPRPVRLPISGPDTEAAPLVGSSPAPRQQSISESDGETYGFQDDALPVTLPPLIPSSLRSAEVEEPETEEPVSAEQVCVPVRPWTDLFAGPVFSLPFQAGCQSALFWLTVGWGLLLAMLIGLREIYVNSIAPRL
jgi:hypothetical protein